MKTIHVAAGLLHDGAGRVLLVRKQGTTAFMQPGGKPDDGERPDVALVREIREELGIDVALADLVPLGEFTADAANEPDHHVAAHAFALQLTAEQVADVAPAAEIAEAVWVRVAEAASLPLAPLTQVHLLGLVPGGGAGGGAGEGAGGGAGGGW